MVEFIAEISSNHNGDRHRCQDLIRAAARCGCHAVKFQLFRIECLFAPEILRVSSRHRQRRRWELPIHFLGDLAACCHDEGLQFGCSPFDLAAVDQLAPFTDFLKISSYELPWTPLIEHCAATGQPLMLSTGMADAHEIRGAADAAFQAGCHDLTLFHCVSNYPVAADNCNLAALQSLRQLVPEKTCRIGWSDHSRSPAVVDRAVKHWHAQAVEFHFDLEGDGAEFTGGHCWLPAEITPLIAGKTATTVEDISDGTGSLSPATSEAEERTWRADPHDGLRPSLAVRQSWPAAQPVTDDGPPVIFCPAGLGLGHISRCLALAEALRDNHRARIMFLINGKPGQRQFLGRHGFTWRLADQPDEILMAVADLSRADGGFGAAICVLDRLADATDLSARLQKAGHSTAVLDQPTCQAADLIIVPSFGWSPPPGCGDISGGTTSLLIREDLRRLRPSAPPVIGDHAILVSFGGSDPHRLTEKTIQALADAPFPLSVQVVVGPDFPPFTAATEQALTQSRFQIVTANDDLGTLLTRADLVITAMGVTVAEAHALGRPVAILTNWPTDADAVARLTDAGLTADLGFGPAATTTALRSCLAHLWDDTSQRQKLAASGWTAVDGQGAIRVAQRIAQLARPQGDAAC